MDQCCLIVSSHFHVIEYIKEEQGDECMGVDIYSSKTAAWICKESKWGRNTCVTIERSEYMRSSETVYLNGCLHIMGYLGPVWLSCGYGKKLLWAMSCGKAVVGCEL